MQVEDLRDQVRRAFEHVGYPATVADMLAAPYSSDDAYEMAAAFHGKRWDAVAIHDLFIHREMLFTLSPAAFVAYLPAYLVASLASDDPNDKYGADVASYMIAALGGTRDKSETRASTSAARLGALTKAQREAAIEVVKYQQERWDAHNAQRALEVLHALG